MEEQIKEMESELAGLRAELVICEKEIAKRNDKQQDYLIEKGEILSDIASVEEELAMLKSLPKEDN